MHKIYVKYAKLQNATSFDTHFIFCQFIQDFIPLFHNICKFGITFLKRIFKETTIVVQ
ncbi:hypothetical protein Hanom_Chr10g00883321 [Helianthus anomalus]